MSNNVKQPKVAGGINWSTRLKSKTFWITTIPTLATIVVSVLSLCGVDGAEDIVNQGTAIATTIVGILAQVGIIVDNNSKGLKDSGMAQELTKPRDENVDPVEFKKYEEEDFSTINPTPVAPTENEIADDEEEDEVPSDLHAEDSLSLEEQAENVEESEVEEDIIPEFDKEDEPKG